MTLESSAKANEAAGAPAVLGLTTPAELRGRASGEWKALAEARVESSPFTDPGWLAAYEGICEPHELKAVAAWQDGRLVGVATLRTGGETWSGLRIRVGRSPTFDWLSRHEFLAASNRDDMFISMWQWWLTRGECEVFRLDLIPETSPTLMIALRLSKKLGWRSVDEPGFRSPWKLLPIPPQQWDSGLKSKFKSNLRNRHLRLEKLGKVEYEVVLAGERQTEALEIFYQLEASGWKGKQGTAIKHRPDVKAFYDRLVQCVARDIWLPILWLDHRPVAAQFIRVCGDALYVLKVGHDPDLHPYSPGQLITARTMQYAMERGIRRFDFLGEEMTWKMDWNTQLLGHRRLTIFAPTVRGRYLYWAQHGIKDFIKRIPGVAPLQRRIRRARKRD